MLRTLVKNDSKDNKMYRQLVSFMNEPYNLRNILKLDEFRLSVWDVEYTVNKDPIETFKKKAEISFDVNYFFKKDRKDEIEQGLPPKSIFEYGDKSYKHKLLKWNEMNLVD